MGSENNIFDEFFFLNILFKDNIYLFIKYMFVYVCIFVYELNIENYVYILNMYLKKRVCNYSVCIYVDLCIVVLGVCCCFDI